MTSFAILFSKVSYEPSGCYGCQIACPQYLWSSVEYTISFFWVCKFNNVTLGVKESRRPNWRPLWWVGVLRFSPNWKKKKEKPSANRVSLTTFVNLDSFSQFLQFWLNLSAPAFRQITIHNLIWSLQFEWALKEGACKDFETS